MGPLKGLLATAAATMALGLAAPALPQQSSGPTAVIAHPLKGGVYWVQGDSANSGFVIGKDGVVVIDTRRTAEAGRAQLAQIAKVTAKPVRTVIITHADPDHVGGLSAYPADATIIAHENIRAQLLATAREPASASPFAGVYKEIAESRLPNRTIAETETVTLSGVPVTLLHIAPAHSTGDIVVFLPRQRVVFVGDLLTMDMATYPIIHVGGSSEGWLRTMRAILALKADTYVSGHGTLKTRQELQALFELVAARRAAIKAMVHEGKSLAEIDAALPEAKVHKQFITFNETTYHELTRGYPDARPPWVSFAPNDPRRRSAAVQPPQ